MNVGFSRMQDIRPNRSQAIKDVRFGWQIEDPRITQEAYNQAKADAQQVIREAVEKNDVIGLTRALTDRNSRRPADFPYSHDTLLGNVFVFRRDTQVMNAFTVVKAPETVEPLEDEIRDAEQALIKMIKSAATPEPDVEQAFKVFLARNEPAYFPGKGLSKAFMDRLGFVKWAKLEAVAKLPH